ncbi:hypothetical protein ES703_26978 [subsurface metagenome]
MLEWIGDKNELNLTGEACTRCGRTIRTDEVLVSFIIPPDKILARLCEPCGVFWLECLEDWEGKVSYRDDDLVPDESTIGWNWRPISKRKVRQLKYGSS